MGHSLSKDANSGRIQNGYSDLLPCYILGFPPYKTEQPPQCMSQEKETSKKMI